MYLLIMLFVVFLICIAFVWNEGAWNNIVTFLMALFSGIMATNYFGYFATYLTYTSGTLSEYTQGGNYLWDIAGFWFIFGLTYALLRLCADRLSRFKVRFRKPVEIGTNIVMAGAIGILMTTLFLFTVHIAPLARHPFGGVFQRTPQMRHLVIGPDKIWMSLADYWSGGALSNLGTVKRFGSSDDFIQRQYWRRRTLEGEKGFWVDMDEVHETADPPIEEPAPIEEPTPPEQPQEPAQP